jgi:hypothetical protein
VSQSEISSGLLFDRYQPVALPPAEECGVSWDRENESRKRARKQSRASDKESNGERIHEKPEALAEARRLTSGSLRNCARG